VIERLLTEARAHRVALALAALVMVAVPVVLSLARDDGYEARRAIYYRESGDGLVRYIERELPANSVARGTALNVRYPLDRDTVVENTRLEARDDGGVDLIAKSGTPERAENMARLESSLVVDRVKRRYERVARDPELAQAVQDSYAPGVTPAERRRLRRKVQRLIQEISAAVPRLETRGPVTSEAVSGSVDEAVDRLPGDFPPNPGPVAAGLGGLSLALAIFAACVIVLPRRETAPRRGA
jgi:hypothetical protein